ncbi:MAG: N-acetylglucosamine-6-phosphate deacetylase [Clostridia bacterium]|nr:N-acetylglucosamine-6-phosphate deacetylase [Clostridia bacterium]
MLIRNAQVFLGRTFRTGEDIRIHNGHVQEIGHNLEAGLYESVVDAQEDYVIPGFVDVHIHAFRGHDTMEGEEAVRKMSRDLYQMGVAAFCPTTMSASVEDTKKAVDGIRAVMERPDEQSAMVLGAHMEAPYLSEQKAGAQRKEFFMDPDITSFDSMVGGEDNYGAIRMITMAPERTGSEEMIRYLTEKGIIVSVGHSAATASLLHASGDWGANHVTHTFNAQTPILHRAPGIPGAAMVDDRFYCEMICDGVHLDGDIVRMICKCKGPGRTVVITDAMEAAGMPDGHYALGGQPVFVKDGQARLEDGTLAGSVLTMKRALENLIHRFDVQPEDAVQMCTATPANSVGEKLAGRITAGAPAPLTRWSKDWTFKEILA